MRSHRLAADGVREATCWASARCSTSWPSWSAGPSARCWATGCRLGCATWSPTGSGWSRWWSAASTPQPSSTRLCRTRSVAECRCSIVLGSVVVGGVIGAALRLESRLEGLGALLQRRLAGGQGAPESRRRFIEGYVTASLVFCVGPLTVLGSLQDGIGDGIELLALKSVLDGFAALAFAASLGLGRRRLGPDGPRLPGNLTVVGALDG